MAFLHAFVSLKAVFVCPCPIVEISTVDDSAKSDIVRRARRSGRGKRRWLPGGRWTTLPSLSLFMLPFPIPRGPLPIFPRTQHVIPAFIIIVIIISADGPLMNRCEDSEGRERFGRDEAREKKEQETIPRHHEQQETHARGGPSQEDKMVKKTKKKWLPGEGGTTGGKTGLPSRVSWLASW